MLMSVDELRDFDLVATDGEIGSIRGVYFDDSSWMMLYLILDTGKWLPGRKVIISTRAIEGWDLQNKKVMVALSKDRIENSPKVDEDEPLSLEGQTRIDNYYGWSGGSPMTSHTQSTRDVIGTYIVAKDGEIGHVEDFIIDNEGWLVRYMVVDTANWWPGKKVLMSTSWVRSLKWTDKKVHVDLTREEIKGSPEYSPGKIPPRAYEERLYGHYGRPGYWIGQAGGCGSAGCV